MAIDTNGAPAVQREASGAYVEHGPPVLRFAAVAASALTAFLSLMMVISPIILLTHTLKWTVCVFQLMFSCTAILMEISPRWLDAFPVAKQFELMLEDKAKFLLRCGGRGLFYLYQGALFTGMFDDWLFVLAGLPLVVCGIGYILGELGHLPKNVVEIQPEEFLPQQLVNLDPNQVASRLPEMPNSPIIQAMLPNARRENPEANGVNGNP